MSPPLLWMCFLVKQGIEQVVVFTVTSSTLLNRYLKVNLEVKLKVQPFEHYWTLMRKD